MAEPVEMPLRRQRVLAKSAAFERLPSRLCQIERLRVVRLLGEQAEVLVSCIGELHVRQFGSGEQRIAGLAVLVENHALETFAMCFIDVSAENARIVEAFPVTLADKLKAGATAFETNIENDANFHLEIKDEDVAGNFIHFFKHRKHLRRDNAPMFPEDQSDTSVQEEIVEQPIIDKVPVPSLQSPPVDDGYEIPINKQLEQSQVVVPQKDETARGLFDRLSKRIANDRRSRVIKLLGEGTEVVASGVAELGHKKNDDLWWNDVVVCLIKDHAIGHTSLLIIDASNEKATILESYPFDSIAGHSSNVDGFLYIYNKIDNIHVHFVFPDDSEAAQLNRLMAKEQLLPAPDSVVKLPTRRPSMRKKGLLTRAFSSISKKAKKLKNRLKPSEPQRYESRSSISSFASSVESDDMEMDNVQNEKKVEEELRIDLEKKEKQLATKIALQEHEEKERKESMRVAEEHAKFVREQNALHDEYQRKRDEQVAREAVAEKEEERRREVEAAQKAIAEKDAEVQALRRELESREAADQAQLVQRQPQAAHLQGQPRAPFPNAGGSQIRMEVNFESRGQCIVS